MFTFRSQSLAFDWIERIINTVLIPTGCCGNHFNVINWHPDHTAALNEEKEKLLFGFKSVKQMLGRLLVYPKLHISVNDRDGTRT